MSLGLLAPPREPETATAKGAGPAVRVTDVHSRLHHTCVREVVVPKDQEQLAAAVMGACNDGRPICVSGCRHAMGGQQFASDETLIDCRHLQRVLSLDPERGLLEVEGGIQWPELIRGCIERQRSCPNPWTIAQKQTGADNFTIAGSLSANIHGRGLAMKPLVSDIESFKLMNANGELMTCSRQRNAGLFRLAIGGYGLFGIIVSVTLRLSRRRKLQRLVKMTQACELMAEFEDRLGQGCLYGDFQFDVDEQSPNFLQRGVLSCYQPIDDGKPLTAPRQISSEHWLQLLHLAYTNRAEAFRRYADHYLATHGQTYWSDLHQLSPYLPDYAARLRQLGHADPSSLLIHELYVPRPQLAQFLADAAGVLRAGRAPVIYGTVRLIEKDNETFLAWAKQSYACVIFNLLTPHTPAGLCRSQGVFRDLIGLATSLGGSFYLTYDKSATRAQVETCYPQFAQFIGEKQKHDPRGVFQSDWFRHYAEAS